MNLPTKTENISFNNTEFAFAYKSDRELRKARFLFSMMGNSFLLNFGLKLMPLAIRWHLPFTRTILRNTIFRQFVGGETLEETAAVANKLAQYKVEVILDYGVEGGHDEVAFDHSTQEFIKVIEYAATQKNIPFISIKITGIARFGLLEKMDAAMQLMNEVTLMKRYTAVVSQLNDEEKKEWERVVERLSRICKMAAEKKIGVLVDAEESWIQDPVDALTILMMDTFNRQQCFVFNTIQLYRHDRLEFLKKSHEAALERDFLLGAKLVRGAYMEKERTRALAFNYLSPIQPDKGATDHDYNTALKYCIERIDRISTIVASHNEESNIMAIELMQSSGHNMNHPHLHFSQLYGMSDNITFNLAAQGCSVSKYLPFGPIKDVVPYLMRRAQENSSVSGQTGRELGLIEKELKRRKG